MACEQAHPLKAAERAIQGAVGRQQACVANVFDLFRNQTPPWNASVPR